jgi:hypothetical protein
MKSRIIRLTTAALIIGSICTSCNPQQRKTDEAQMLNDSMEHPHNIADTLNVERQDWEKFKTDAEAQLIRNQDTIAAYKSRAQRGAAKLKARYNQRIAKLDEENIQLKKRIDEYKEEGKANWDKFKLNFSNDLDTLNVQLKEVFKDSL